MKFSYEAYNAYLSVKEKESKDCLIPKVRQFEFYLKE